MKNNVELTRGEIRVALGPYAKGKLSLKSFGLSDEDMSLKGKPLRLVFEMATTQNNYSKKPELVLTYKEDVEAAYCQCDFNKVTVAEHINQEKSTTTILLNREKLSNLENHHNNTLTLQADFAKAPQIDAAKSYVNFFH